MDKKILIAYELLVPTDQLVVDAIIVTLAKKDKQISDLVYHVDKTLEKD